MKTRFLTIISASALLASAGAQAAVHMPSVLTDGMVVQRGEPVRLWGTADPGETVTARTSAKKSKAVTVTADSLGQWQLELAPLKAGGPYTITVGDITLSDVLSGDVFLCSGQSNMELPVRRVTDMFADEIASYENPSIRQYVVPQTTAFDGPQSDTRRSAWLPCTQDNVMNYSALAYFFAKQLNETTGVPVGIINASWGGTPVEAWMSEESLAPWPMAVAKKKIYEDDGYRNRIKKLEGENYAHWNAVLYASDPGRTASVQWSEPAFDDSKWDEVDLVESCWGKDIRTRRNLNGSHWLRRHVAVSASQAAGPATLRLGCIEGADSAFVNGVFVGTIGYQYPPRIYNVPAGVLHEGDNVVTVRVISSGGEPKVVPDKPYKLIFADGSETSLEGLWRHRQGADMPSGPGMMFYHYTPAVLYNAMITPLFRYPVSAAVWYQGESNVSNRYDYAAMLKTMIAGWRDGFGRADLPFYIVELADFLHSSDVHGRKAWAEMRAEQARVADETPGATLIRNSDLGEWNDIHPLDKKTLGQRVAAAVLQSLPKK
ncbi:MAG: sialate O-acetylesterase [Muribaculaceae bacterium]|nr:sialate O-acetylesterase [Muribaculaceae bacterium]